MWASLVRVGQIPSEVDTEKYVNERLQDYLSDGSSRNTSAPKDEKSINQIRTVLLESGFVFGSGDDSSLMGPRVVAQLDKLPKYQRKITLLVPERDHPLVNAVQVSFQASGIACDRCTHKDKIPQGQDVISILDFGEPYLYNITEAKFRDFVNRLSSFKGSMIWVTPSAQMSCSNPNSSMILGLTRTLRAELRKDITTVEMNDEATTYTSSSQSLLNIYQGLGQRPKARDSDPDYEYAIVDGDIKIPRVHWTTVDEELAKLATDESSRQNLPTPYEGRPIPIHFRSDACYLLVGGLGGLGRVISRWMVENGARNILFLSRSANEGPETTPFFDELRRRGCVVSAFAGDVASLSDVKAAIEQAPVPVGGIIQMSAVMRVCMSVTFVGICSDFFRTIGCRK